MQVPIKIKTFIFKNKLPEEIDREVNEWIEEIRKRKCSIEDIQIININPTITILIKYKISHFGLQILKKIKTFKYSNKEATLIDEEVNKWIDKIISNNGYIENITMRQFGEEQIILIEYFPEYM